MTFTERLRYVIDQGWVPSARAWSLSAGRSHSQVGSLIDRGLGNATHEVLKDLADAAGVRKEWLADGHGPPRVDGANLVDADGDNAKDAARVQFLLDAGSFGEPADRVTEFLREFDRRAHQGAGESFEWWLAQYKDGWRKHKAAAKGKGGPFGVGTRAIVK